MLGHKQQRSFQNAFDVTNLGMINLSNLFCVNFFCIKQNTVTYQTPMLLSSFRLGI